MPLAPTAIVIDGRTFDSIHSAAIAFGLSRNTVDYRLSRGWTPEEAVGLEPRPSLAGKNNGVAVNVEGRDFKSIKDAAKHYGRAYTHIFDRLKAGCTIEEALGLVKRTDSLQTEYPELANQWHPTRNASLTPDTVTPHSGQKAWWLCPRGHEWDAVINSRTRGHSCPFCAGQRPTPDRNFAIEFPDLLNEWDWERNNPRNPESFTPRSTSKVWWRCGQGHSWQASIGNRTRKTANLCPICSNRLLSKENSLARVRPDIAKDWHPHKNSPESPSDVIAGGSKKVWWICKHGHEWRATVGSRVNAGSGCRKCSLQTSRIEIAIYAEFDALFDDVMWREKFAGFECDIYLRERNIGIEVDGVYWHSRRPEQELAKSAVFEREGIQLFRLREEGLPLLSERDVSFKFSDDEFVVTSRLVAHLLKYAELSEQQRLTLADYIDGARLINDKYYRDLVASLPAPPPGQSLADKQPEIAKQWAFDLNAPLLPEHFRHKANKSVWWRCENGHTWKVSINNRTQHGTGCPDCSGQTPVAPADRNLALMNPALVSEWHPEKNGDLHAEHVWPKSNRRVWWLCNREHAWKAAVSSRASGSGCPYCYGRYASENNNLASNYPELLADWDEERNRSLNPSEITPHVNKKVWWRCRSGHIWQATIYNRTKNKSGCPDCAQAARRKYSIEHFQSIAGRRGGKCLSQKYTSSRDKLKFSCKEGHVWETRADGILYTHKWCPQCAN